MLSALAGASVDRPRFRMVLLSAFGLTTCLLSVLGVQGVMALAVARRRREPGVRLALGATAAGLLRQTLGRGLALVAVGAAGARRTRQQGPGAMLFAVAPSDPATYLTVIASTMRVALLACWLPATSQPHRSRPFTPGRMDAKATTRLRPAGREPTVSSWTRTGRQCGD